MVTLPIVLGLSLCERVIIEQGSRNPSLINLFLSLPVPDFPTEPARFSAFAALTDCEGDGLIELLAAV